MDSPIIGEVFLSRISEIEDHRVEGELCIQYRMGKSPEPTYTRHTIVLELSEYDDLPDFTKLTIAELQRLFVERLKSICGVLCG